MNIFTRSLFTRCVFEPGREHNYVIGGNVCNSFVIGEVSSEDDFWLAGAERVDTAGPLLSGCVFDSRGQYLFTLRKNSLVTNPMGCLKVSSGRWGFEIRDSSGIVIMKVETVFDFLPAVASKLYVTTLTGRFYDKRGRLVFLAQSGEVGEAIEADVKCAFGHVAGSRGFGLAMNVSEEDRLRALAVLAVRFE